LARFGGIVRLGEVELEGSGRGFEDEIHDEG
jgi:hypothetical protein